ncbi:hypothetical protein INR49_018456 [Caranx melampygus]|nr:hypothetical protein INR49_018456 [Caranx melampygus]
MRQQNASYFIAATAHRITSMGNTNLNKDFRFRSFALHLVMTLQTSSVLDDKDRSTQSHCESVTTVGEPKQQPCTLIPKVFSYLYQQALSVIADPPFLPG